MRDVIIACDFSSKKETLEFLSKFKDTKPFVKIGMELYYAEGPSIVKEIKELGHKVFLDLKLHDIPNTVYKAMKNIGALKVDMTNVHAAGGITMMQQARKALDEVNKDTILIAVTQLTSTTQQVMEDELLINKDINDVVLEYAKNANKASLQGIVCSPLEASLIKNNIENFITVTPGIRFNSNNNDDQKRITTPEQAREIGSDYIVVGRPITADIDPVSAYNKCMKDFKGE